MAPCGELRHAACIAAGWARPGARHACSARMADPSPHGVASWQAAANQAQTAGKAIDRDSDGMNLASACGDGIEVTIRLAFP